MEKKGNTQNFVIIALTIAVVIMSVGFALSDISLSLAGNTTVSASSWDVHFQANSFTKQSTSTVTASNVSISDTSVTYDVTLAEVGDVFDYNIVVENKGSFDAALKTITITDTSTHSNYLSFEVGYNNKTYTGTSNTIATADQATLTAKTGTETINLKAEYLKPDDAANLPSADQTISITVTLVYEEKTAA